MTLEPSSDDQRQASEAESPPGDAAEPTTEHSPEVPSGAQPSRRRLGVARAALIVGIAAFVTGWIPILGLLLGSTGIILGIVAMRKPGSKLFGRLGFVASVLALVTNVAVTVVVVVSLVNSGIGTAVLTDAQPVITPCYSFNGPGDYSNTQSAETAEACVTSLELQGDYDADGQINNTGTGMTLGSVLVEPVLVSSTDQWAPSGSLDDMVTFLNRGYFPDAGEVTSLKESVTLDGTEANLTRLTSTSEKTQTKAFLTVFAPKTYQAVGQEVKFFVISFVVPGDNGEEIIATAVDSWRWK